MKTKPTSKDPSFEEALHRLESIVTEMEGGNLSLEDILKKYEDGNHLVRLCSGKLQEAEKRIEILMKEKNGSLHTESLSLDEQDSQDIPTKEPAATTKEKDLF